jgi:PKD repeat protein
MSMITRRSCNAQRRRRSTWGHVAAFAALLLAALQLGCGPTDSGGEDGTGPPSASFTQSATSAEPCAVIQFTDTSAGNVTSWAWHVAGVGTSTRRNPAFEFLDRGTYTVSLEVAGTEGVSSVTKTDLVTIAGGPAAQCQPIASFTQDVTFGAVGTTVQFTDTSTDRVTKWAWDFGDGIGTSEDQHPSYTYTEPGNYTVSLTVKDSRGEDTVEYIDLIRIGVAQAGFACEPTVLEGFAPFDVTCTADDSAFADSWAWEFGDTTGASDERDPSYRYTTAGSFTITQTATNELGTDSDSTTVTVHTLDITADPSGGAAPLAVLFTANDSSGALDEWSWKIDGDERVEPSGSLAVNFLLPATYTVEVTGSSTTSDLSATATLEYLVDVGPPVAGFDCDLTGLEGYVPFTVSCTANDGAYADSWSWDFGDGSEPSTERDATHTYTSAVNAPFTITQTGTIGTDEASATAQVDVFELGITITPPTGPAPLDAMLSPDDPGGLLTTWSWQVDGELVPNSRRDQPFRFLKPGEHHVFLTGYRSAVGVPAVAANAETTITLGFGPPEAGIDDKTVEGFGPLAARLLDRSGGVVTQWEWDFGDGTSCIFPAPEIAPDPPVEVCDDSSPAHVYADSGAYSVGLTVTGPAFEGEDPPTSTSPTTRANHVRVYVSDPGFEQQTADAEIGGAWETVYPDDATEATQHLALTQLDPPGADLAMPTEGNQWAMIDGLGTDGQTAVEEVENGLRQTILHPPGQPVLEFDFALLFSEPPASGVLDASIATITDGVVVVPVQIPGSAADTQSPYVGVSTRYPTRDGSVMRTTPTLTASIDLGAAFPGSNELTPFELTFRTTNGPNDQSGFRRSPRLYVDNVRFTTPVDEIAPEILPVSSDPFRVGDTIAFTNRTCTEVAIVESEPVESENADCLAETSWRWDFDTRGSITPPTTTGSAEYSPSYTFEERGSYTVELVARRANAEGTTDVEVTVFDPLEAAFTITTEAPYSTSVPVEFEDASSTDVDDPIIEWSWDFGGWGTSTQQTPLPVQFGQTGSYMVTLTVTTQLGYESTTQQQITID